MCGDCRFWAFDHALKYGAMAASALICNNFNGVWGLRYGPHHVRQMVAFSAATERLKLTNVHTRYIDNGEMS